MSTRHCPVCQSDQVRRTHARSLGDKLLKLTAQRSYHCEHCGARFHSWVSAKSARRIFLNVLVCLVAGLLVGAFVRWFSTRETPGQE